METFKNSKNVDVKFDTDKAQTVYINHPTASFGTFCFNSKGDLFLNSDWGFHGYAWRAFGTDFKGFLAGLNVDYLLDKFEYNINMSNRNKKPYKFNSFQREALTDLCQSFIDYLRKEKELLKVA